MSDPHHAARAVVGRAVTGAPVTERELADARAHIESCAVCVRHFDLDSVRPFLERSEDNVPDMAEPEEPIALFERWLTAGLSDPETIIRLRSAERLGAFPRLGPVALDALAATAAEDDDEETRETALAALDRLDAEVSLSQRLIDQWAETPAEAAPYLADVLERLSAPQKSPRDRVTQLVASPSDAAEELVLSGDEGITGRLRREKEELWLRLHELPQIFERAKLIVAVPNALERDTPEIRWSGAVPGLVAAQAPVARGSLDVLLGDVRQASEPAVSEKLFGRVYLLNPREQRGV